MCILLLRHRPLAIRTYFSASLQRTSFASAATYQSAPCLIASRNRILSTIRLGLQISSTMDFALRPDTMADDEARSFSTQQERASDASEIELRPLVSSTASAMQQVEVPERITELHNDTSTAASPGDIDEPIPKGESSLHSPGSGMRTKHTSILKALLFDSWIGEAIVMALSMCCLVAIALIVRHYDGKPLPQWRGGVTLNTVISVLSTTARSGMIFVVSATIGQLKWCSLGQTRRRISDMQAMDDASRGPLGAAKILTSLTGGTMGTLGAATTVLMVAFSPFLQQLLSYPLHEVEQTHLSVWAPRNSNYTSFFANGNTSPDLFKAIEAGLWSEPRLLEPIFPTTHCEWDNFKSVGWCSKCTDLTDSAVLSDCNIMQYFQNMSSPRVSCLLDLGTGNNFSLVTSPFNESVIGGDDKHVVRVAVDATWKSSSGRSDWMETYDPDSSSYKPIEDIDQDYAVLAFGHAQLSLSPSFIGKDWQTEEPVDIVHVQKASQFILTLCERDVVIETESGIVRSTLSSPNYGNLFGYTDPTLLSTNVVTVTPSEYSETYCWQPENRTTTLVGISGAEGPDGQETFMDRNTGTFCPVGKYSNAITEYFTANASLDVYKNMFNDDPDAQIQMADTVSLFVGHAQNPPSINIVGNKSIRSFDKRLENVATALTNYGLEMTTETAPGRAYAEKSYVQVRWQWIILPVLLQLSTLVLFILTVLYSQLNGVPIWKSSILAIIYHAAEDLDEKKDVAAERLSGMDAVAQMDKVQFSRSADGIHHLYGRSHG